MSPLKTNMLKLCLFFPDVGVLTASRLRVAKWWWCWHCLVENVQTTHEDLPSPLRCFICIDRYLAQSALLEVVGLIGVIRQKNSGDIPPHSAMVPEY